MPGQTDHCCWGSVPPPLALHPLFLSRSLALSLSLSLSLSLAAPLALCLSPRPSFHEQTAVEQIASLAACVCARSNSPAASCNQHLLLPARCTSSPWPLHVSTRWPVRGLGPYRALPAQGPRAMASGLWPLTPAPHPTKRSGHRLAVCLRRDDAPSGGHRVQVTPCPYQPVPCLTSRRRAVATAATGSSEAKPSEAKRSQAKRNHATPSEATRSHAKPNAAKRRDATRRHAKPRQATPRHATPRHAHVPLRDSIHLRFRQEGCPDGVAVELPLVERVARFTCGGDLVELDEAERRSRAAAWQLEVKDCPKGVTLLLDIVLDLLVLTVDLASQSVGKQVSRPANRGGHVVGRRAPTRAPTHPPHPRTHAPTQRRRERGGKVGERGRSCSGLSMPSPSHFTPYTSPSSSTAPSPLTSHLSPLTLILTLTLTLTRTLTRTLHRPALVANPHPQPSASASPSPKPSPPNPHA